MKYQVTMLNTTGEYRPVSCIVEVEDNGVDYTKTREKNTIINKGIQKICVKRRWNKTDLKRYNYTRVKVRIYDQEEIEQQNRDSYALVSAINNVNKHQKKC